MATEQGRLEYFQHVDGRRATLSYGLDSGDMHAWLVSITPRVEIFPDAYQDEGHARAWLTSARFAFDRAVVEWVDDRGYAFEIPA